MVSLLKPYCKASTETPDWLFKKHKISSISVEPVWRSLGVRIKFKFQKYWQPKSSLDIKKGQGDWSLSSRLCIGLEDFRHKEKIKNIFLSAVFALSETRIANKIYYEQFSNSNLRVDIKNYWFEKANCSPS